MKRIRKWLGLCEHHWVILTSADIFRDRPLLSDRVKVGVKYTLQCSECGNIKTVKSEV